MNVNPGLIGTIVLLGVIAFAVVQWILEDRRNK